MAEYTPTIHVMRERYWLATVNDPNFPGAEGYANDKRAEFDRGLAQHDAELRAEVERLRGVERGWQHDRAEWERERDEARRQVADLRALVESGEASDGHHTHRELYEYRLLYNAHAAHGWLAAGLPVVKSWKHSDGEPCFGGGWFIVTATLPTGQVSNHYRAEHWDLFDVPAVNLPPEYDGHTPADAAERLRALLAGSGEQPGEDHQHSGPWLREGVDGRMYCQTCGPNHPAPVDPDSADARERLIALFHSAPYQATQYAAAALADEVLAVVGQGATVEHLPPRCPHGWFRTCMRCFEEADAAARPSGQEGS